MNSGQKKILIISRSFYPSNWPRAFRTTELAKEFARKGHAVHVIIPKQNIHIEFEKKYGITITDLGKPTWKTVEVRGNGVRLFICKVLNRLLSWLFEYPNIELIWMVGKSVKRLRGYDLVISIAHPYAIHWGVARALKLSEDIAKVWVADCGDPYMGQEITKVKPPFYFMWVEKWFMRKADYISVPTRESITAYYPEFHNKIRVIPQGFRLEDINIYKGDPPSQKTIFGYAGMFIPKKRDPSEFIEFLLSLDKKYEFEFHIFTHNRNVIEPFLTPGCERIILWPVKARDEVMYDLSKMHFVVNFENNGIKHTPSKLIDYAIIKKPVLSISYGNLDRETILEFLSGDYRHRRTIPDVDQYKIENVARSFLDLVDERRLNIN
jgi:glycosyltransferase involved in cell wall biosynthesis